MPDKHEPMISVEQPTQPLTAIIGQLQQLRRDTITDPETLDRLRIVEEQAGRLRTMFREAISAHMARPRYALSGDRSKLNNLVLLADQWRKFEVEVPENTNLRRAKATLLGVIAEYLDTISDKDKARMSLEF